MATCLLPSDLGGMRPSVAARYRPQKTDRRHRRLLRARRDRPRRSRAAEQRDEVAPVHCPMPPVLPTGRIARLRTGGDCCIDPTLGGRAFNVRSWERTGHAGMAEMT